MAVLAEELLWHAEYVLTKGQRTDDGWTTRKHNNASAAYYWRRYRHRVFIESDKYLLTSKPYDSQKIDEKVFWGRGSKAAKGISPILEPTYCT